MNGFDRMHHRLSMVVSGVLAIAVGALLIVLGSADDAAGRGATPVVGNGEGRVALDPIGEFDNPVNVAFAPGSPENVYVVEQDGTVEVLVNDAEPETFLDIQDETNGSGERGLLSVAFHPDFESNSLVYAYYTDAANGDIVVSEFNATAMGADETSMREVIRVPHRLAPNHNGGQLLFGPDGYLYMGTGDGGDAGDPRENAQNRRSLLGKLLRINPLDPVGPREYTSPGGNPFAGRSGRDEIFARGLRNPFRFTFDEKTGRIAIGDVGQGSFEEVDYETHKGLRNANFGWDRWEGRERYREGDEAKTPKRKNHDKPVFVYGRSACGGGCAVIGGVVVRDPELDNLYGRYLFADAYAGRLRSFVPQLGQVRRAKYLSQASVGFVSSFAADPVSDQIYVTTLGEPGDVYRLEPALP